MLYRLKQGYDIPLEGAAVGGLQSIPAPDRVALVARDFGYPRVSLAVEAGQPVSEGSVLFTDRRHPEVRFVAPASGVISRIDRGPRRRIEAVVIDIGDGNAVEFPTVAAEKLASLSAASIRERLLATGLWTAFRARPYDRIPSPDIEPRAIFVTAIDTNPLAPDPGIALEQSPAEFRAGLAVVSRLSGGKTCVCTAAGREALVPDIDGVTAVQFGGAHPAGLPGTHIHALGLPIGKVPDIWHLGCQDVIAIGQLYLTGYSCHERIIGICGPAAPEPRVVRARIGSALSALCGVGSRPDCRIISGSVLSGYSTPGFLGRYHNQVTVMPRTGSVGTSLGNAARMILRGLPGRSPVDGCDKHGWADAMLPLASYDRVWPYQSPPAVLLRALLTGDLDTAELLGCRGLAEEDLSLLTYVSAGKHDYAAALRGVLQRLERAA